ncbi:uncharacterized protein [Rhodnius prolixus]|uniref:uncharacterized protein n=1 Tax=Rhodnius prolixus TaxID=13249 RepID=UPI003D18B862
MHSSGAVLQMVLIHSILKNEEVKEIYRPLRLWKCFSGLSSQLPWSSGLYGRPTSWPEQYGYWPAEQTRSLNSPVYKIIKPRFSYEESFSQPGEENGNGRSPGRY